MIRSSLALLIALALVSAWPACATVRHVPADYATIQGAIEAAAVHDTVLVAPGTYYENINFHGKNIVVAGNYLLSHNPAEILTTIINGSQPVNPDTGSCVRLVSGEDSTAVLEGFTLTGGTGTPLRDQSNGQTYVEGGGIMLENSSANILHNIIIGNHADRHPTGITSAGGGGIRAGFGYPRIIGNVILRNTGRYGGGVVINFDGAIVRNNIIGQNTGGQDFGGSGLWMYGIYQGAYSHVENNTIIANVSALDGGGMYVWSTNVVARNNIVWGNRANRGAPQISQSGGSFTLTYSDIQGGYTGTGNLDAYPLFADSFLTLLAGSPCIDTGDPDPAINDPNGTRSDMGAFGGPMAAALAFDSQPSMSFAPTRVDFGAGGPGVQAAALLAFVNNGPGGLRIDSFHVGPNARAIISFQNSVTHVGPVNRDTLRMVWAATEYLPLADTIWIYHNDPSQFNPTYIPLIGHLTESAGGPPSGLPSQFALRQNYPNPFNPATEIRFELPVTSEVRLDIFDTLGRHVVTLVDESRVAGVHAVVWDAKGESSGVYFCRLRAGQFEHEIRMSLLK